MPHCLPSEPASASCPSGPNPPARGARSTFELRADVGWRWAGSYLSDGGIVVGGSVLVMYGRAEQGIACDVRLIIQ